MNLRLVQFDNHVSVSPARDGRVDLALTGDGKLLDGTFVMPAGQPLRFSIGHLAALAHLDRMAPGLMRKLIRSVSDISPVLTAAIESQQRHQQALAGNSTEIPDAPVKITDAERASLRTAVQALSNLSDGFGEQVTLEHVRFAGPGAGQSAEAALLSAGFGIDAPGGILTAHVNFALDGLQTPAVPPGVLHDDLPRHVAVSMHASGVSGKRLTELLLLAIDSSASDTPPPIPFHELTREGAITQALDDLALDFGPVSLRGSGEMRTLDGKPIAGHATFTATGLDALITQANTEPMLRQGAPALILLKGLARPDGDKLVWDIVLRDGKWLVNGNDVSGMVPGK